LDGLLLVHDIGAAGGACGVEELERKGEEIEMSNAPWDDYIKRGREQ
jgi:hypothetical protein